MSEKEENDINESKAAELSSPEELDLNDQIEIVPAEIDTVEPLILLQDEVVSEEAQNESGKSDRKTSNEVEVPPVPTDVESELSSKEGEAENLLETADEQNDGQSDLDEFDDDDFMDLDDEKFDDKPPQEQDPPLGKKALESQENGKSEKKSEEDNEPAENQKDSNDNIGNSVKSTGQRPTIIKLTKVLFIQQRAPNPFKSHLGQ